MNNMNSDFSGYKYKTKEEADEVHRQRARERYENNKKQILQQQKGYKRKKREQEKPFLDLYKQIMSNPQLYQNFINYVHIVSNPQLYQHFVNYVNQISQMNPPSQSYQTIPPSNNQSFELVINPSTS
jgi:hypothetical protein